MMEWKYLVQYKPGFGNTAAMRTKNKSVGRLRRTVKKTARRRKGKRGTRSGRRIMGGAPLPSVPETQGFPGMR